MDAGLSGAGQQAPFIRQICVQCFLPEDVPAAHDAAAALPFLVLLLSDGTLAVYKAFRCAAGRRPQLPALHIKECCWLLCHDVIRQACCAKGFSLQAQHRQCQLEICATACGLVCAAACQQLGSQALPL